MKFRIRQLKIHWMIANLVLVSFLFGFECEAKESTRQRVIDFEDEVVEGLNKRPLDSLNQISERNRRKQKPHLYRKRAGFRTETAETLRELRYLP